MNWKKNNDKGVVNGLDVMTLNRVSLGKFDKFYQT